MARRLFYFFLPTLFLLIGCRHGDRAHKRVFYWNIATGITSMDPAFARIQPNIWVVNQLFDGLVNMDDSLHVIPAIAKSWRISEDGLDYTFTLRNDVFFQDHPQFPQGKGRRVVAADVVYSFNRLLDPAVASPGSWIFNDKVKMLDSIHGAFFAPNDTTFEIRLEKAFRPFLQILTLKYASIVPKEIEEYYGKDFRSHPVGTGPFQLLYNYEGEKIVLARNPDYYEKENGQALPYLDRVVISFIPSKQNEFFSFVKGDLSLLSGLDQSFKDNLLTREGELKEKFKGKFQFEKVPYLNTEYLGVLVDSQLVKGSPLGIKKVRQAINYAVDRRKMIRYLRNNVGVPGNGGFVPPSLLPTDKVYYEYNPAKARQLLREAGFKEGETISGISIVTVDQYLDMAVYVQKQLEDIGIKVEINNVPTSTLSEWKAQSKAKFFRGSWIADYADPENYFSIFYGKNWSPGGPNYFHYKNARFDMLYEQSLKEPDDAKRKAMYLEMQDILMEDAPVVVLYYDQVVRLKANGVEGLNPNPINIISLKKVRIEDF